MTVVGALKFCTFCEIYVFLVGFCFAGWHQALFCCWQLQHRQIVDCHDCYSFLCYQYCIHSPSYFGTTQHYQSLLTPIPHHIHKYSYFYSLLYRCEFPFDQSPHYSVLRMIALTIARSVDMNSYNFLLVACCQIASSCIHCCIDPHTFAYKIISMLDGVGALKQVSFFYSHFSYSCYHTDYHSPNPHNFVVSALG